MYLVLVRHTKTIIPEGICYGQSDVLPDHNFLDHAVEIRKKLQFFKPDKVFTSPLIRCNMLANECNYLNILNDNRLKEYNFGDWELMAWNSIRSEYADTWMNDFVKTPAPGGESLIQMNQRVMSFVDELKETACKNVLCFTHAGVIRLISCMVNGIGLEKAFEFQIEYGGVYGFELPKG